MPLAKCALCHEERELRRSHFIPAAFYRLAKEEENPNPVIVGGGSAIKISNEARAHLLCDECEQRFNGNGEAWVTKHAWHSETDFPLNDLLKSVPPVHAGKGLLIHEGANIPGVDIKSLVYFAASVLWRAGVRDWQLGKKRIDRLDLGPYEEELRLFLLGRVEFPRNIAVAVSVSSSNRVLHNEFVLFPHLAKHDMNHRQYRFTIPGITFQLFTGKGMPFAVRALCTANATGSPIYIAEVMDEEKLRDGWELIRTSKPRGRK